jgi:hypothetical protein
MSSVSIAPNYRLNVSTEKLNGEAVSKNVSKGVEKVLGAVLA